MRRCLGPVLAVSLLAAGAAAGCSENQLGTKGPGDRCTRSTECQAGLACVVGMCSSDIGALAEAGMVPVISEGGVDAAPGVDAGDVDAGDVDAGTPIMGMDAGPMMMGTDAGPMMMGTDAGPMMMGTDAGPPPMPDAGPPPMPDAGPPPMPDAGDLDAG